jgi:PKD repeat protein
MAYDAHSGYVVWVGGSVAGGSETFTYQNGTWTNRTPSLLASPPSTPGGMVAADPAMDAILLVGGYLGSPTLGTWAFANGSWTNLTGTLGTAPGFREDGSLSYDPATGDVVLFGGLGIGMGLSDTWTLGVTGWAPLSPSPHPSARWLAGLAYDGADGTLLLEGGVYGSTYYNDTWTWSGSAWTEVAGATAPAGLAGGRDALASAPGGGVVGFGGLGCPATYGVCNGTYEFQAGAWSRQASGSAPSPRFGMELTYDAHDGYVLGFGGAVGVGVGSNQSWALGGPVVAWLKLEPPIAQPPAWVNLTTTAGGGYGIYTYLYTPTHLDCKSVNLSKMPCLLDLDDNGTTTVSVRVTDQGGNWSSADASLVMLPPLSAFDHVSASVIDVGQSVNFSVTVAPPSIGVNFTWSGLPAECPFTYVRNFTCTPDRPGFYGISCVVIDSIGGTLPLETYTVNVSARPTVVAWPNRTSGSTPFSVQFESIRTGGSAPFTYAWNFGDGDTSNRTAPLYTYTTAGVFPVTLSVSDAAGIVATWSSPASIVVGAALHVVISDSAASWQAPAEVQLASTVTGGVGPYTYAWTLGDGGTASLANVSENYTTPGAYPINLTVTDRNGLVAAASTVLAVLGPSPSSGGGSSGLPLWEIAAIAALALVVGIVAGVWYGGRRPARPEPPAAPTPTPAPEYSED